MGAQGVSKDKETSVDTANIYLAKCNDCECDIRLRCERELKPEQVDELQERILCSVCLNKKVGAKK